MDRVRNLTLQRANSDYSKQGFGHYDLLQVCVLHASCMTVPLHEEATSADWLPQSNTHVGRVE
jgi:hypothetical protein